MQIERAFPLIYDSDKVTAASIFKYLIMLFANVMLSLNETYSKGNEKIVTFFS